MRARFENVVLDTDLRELERGSRKIALTPKAFLLLETLIAAHPAAVSKEQLYETLWPGVFVEPGNLHNIVSEARSAIGDQDHALIRTVHRFGYSLAAALVREERSSFHLLIGEELRPLPEGETIIGRAMIDSPEVSRRHARVRIAGDSATIEDLESKNGTFVDGKRVTKKAALRDGQEILLGRRRIFVRVLGSNTRTVTARPLSGNRESTRRR